MQVWAPCRQVHNLVRQNVKVRLRRSVGAAAVPAEAQLVTESSLVINVELVRNGMNIDGVLLKLLGGEGARLCAALGLQARSGLKMVFICGAINSMVGHYPA